MKIRNNREKESKKLAVKRKKKRGQFHTALKKSDRKKKEAKMRTVKIKEGFKKKRECRCRTLLVDNSKFSVYHSQRSNSFITLNNG